MRHMGVTVLLGLLSACALQEFGPENFHKPRMTAERRTADLRDCFHVALGFELGREIYYDETVFRHPAIVRCMNQRDYLARTCKQCPPSPYLPKASGDAAVRFSRRQLDESVAAFDACLGRAAQRAAGRMVSPRPRWLAQLILSRCENKRRLAELAVIHAAQVEQDYASGKEDSNVAAERFNTRTAPAMAGDHIREAIIRRQ